MILVTLLACGLISAPAVAQDVAATYKATCAACHGSDGTGSAAGQKMGIRAFASPEVKAESDAQLAEVITNGKGKMPAWGKKLSEAQINALVAYVRKLKK